MITPFGKFLSIFLVFFITLNSAITGGNRDSNIVKITENLTDGLLSGVLSFASSDIKDADKIIAAAADDGDGNLYFPDVDYSSKDRTNWSPSRHIARTQRLAVLYRLETDEAKKAEYCDCILRLIDHWTANDYQSDNWWYNRLSNANVLGEIGVLMKNDLSSRQLKKLAQFVARGSLTTSIEANAHTGANSIDFAMSTIKFGAMTGNRQAIKKAVRVVSEELKYQKGEGLKDDATFFQHGNRLYMGGYGIEFISGMSQLVFILSGTDYIFTEKQLTPFADFIVDGLQVMSFGNTLDPTTMGRSVSRHNAQPLGSAAYALSRLAAIEEMPRRDEIKEYVSSIQNNTKKDYGLKYFPTAKHLVINNGDFYFSFRGGDEDLVYSEIINDENVLGYNSSYPGVTTIMHTGKEYRDIAPVCDYSLIPGTTAVYETDEELFAHDDFTYRYLKGEFPAASADGAAVCSAQTTHEGIDMTVSCFATDNAAILLGAGMKDAKGRAMITTLDQCFYTGNFTHEGNTVIHNGIKYTVLNGGTLSAGSRHVVGDWHRNNIPNAPQTAEADIFTVTIENTGSYAYTVMSEKTDAEFEVIMNTEKIQAVKLPDGRIAAAFFAKGSFTFDGETYTGKAGEAKIFG